MSKSRLKFRTHVLLKNIIGQDLINNDNIAILELVKNSFDAGSKTVNIEFKNLKQNDDDIIKEYSNETSKIIIQDFGSGMSQKDINEKWLNIAYSEKKIKKEEFGRLLAGAKGIGRFSCDRLGKYLDIYTKTKKSSSYIRLLVDWTKFEVEGDKDLQIQNIPVFSEKISAQQFTKRTGYKAFKNGTILEISKLRSTWTFKENIIEHAKDDEIWNLDALLSLKKYLERLVNPNQAFGEKNKFEIKVIANEFKKEDQRNKRARRNDLVINGNIENKIFKELNFKATSIEAFVKKTIKGKFLNTVLRDKGREIYNLVEDVSNNKLYKFLENTNIIIYFLNTYSKIYFARQTGQRSVEFGSIFLFKNGFRVNPYGDEGDDWMGLEVRKGQGQRRFLGTRDIVGRIEVKDYDNIFRIVTSREGLVNNQAFFDLRDFFYVILKRLEKYVVDGLKWDSIPLEVQKEINKKGSNFKEELFQLTKDEKDSYALEAIRGLVKTQGKDIKSLKINSEIIYSLAEEQKEKFDSFYSDLEKVGIPKLDRNLKNSLIKLKGEIEKRDEEIKKLKANAIDVSTDDVFSKQTEKKDDKEVVALQHHINQSTERIRFHLHELRKMIDLGSSKEKYLNYVDRISFENKKISTLAKFVTKAKFNLVTAIVEQDIIQFIEEYITNVYPYYEHKMLNRELIGVVILMKESFEFKLKFRPIDLIIIIDNLLDNAQKAGASLVELYIEKNGKNSILLRFKDNGRGLDKSISNPNDIYNFGFTTTKTGTGIGLYHVKEVLSKMHGSISFSQHQNGIEFRIIINRN